MKEWGEAIGAMLPMYDADINDVYDHMLPNDCLSYLCRSV